MQLATESLILNMLQQETRFMLSMILRITNKISVVERLILKKGINKTLVESWCPER